MAEHKDIPVGEVHSPFQWEVLTTAELSTIEPDGVNDVRKVAFVVDDGTGNPTAYVLTQFTPTIEWKPLVSVIGGGGSVVWGGITGTVVNQADLVAYLQANYQPANANIQSHISSTLNPHSTTAAQVGAYTTTETNNAISAAIAALVDTSPTTLDTLNELAAALGNDPAFSTTVLNLISGKANTSHSHVLADITDYTAYALPTASPTVLGGVKVGAGLAIDGVGLLSVTGGGTSAKTVQSTTANTVSTESVTMINLPELTVALAANSTYEIEGFLPLQQSNTNGYALQFITPSDCQPFYYVTPAINAGTSATHGHLLSATAGTVTVTTGSVSAAGVTMVPHFKAIIKTVSAGTLVLNFRYNNATAGTTTILAGATIVVEKIQ